MRLFTVEAINPFNTVSEEVQFGDTMLQFAEGTARTYERTPERIAADAVDAIGVCLFISGRASGETPRGLFQVAPGELFVLDMTQPSKHSVTDNASVQWAIPRVLAEQYLEPAAELHGVVIDSQRSAPIFSHVAALRAAVPILSIDQGAPLARNLLELLAIMLNRTAMRAPDQTEMSSARLAAERAVERQLDDRSLDATSLCHDLGISRAQLFRLFKRDGGVRSYIRARRLERIRAALEDQGERASLAELADRWGFSDASHLSRLFNAQFGLSPSIYRKKRK